MNLDELDKLAAEKIMGWTWFEGHGLWKTNMGYMHDGELLPYWPKDKAIRGTTETYPRWQPTSNIVQAWECLECIPKRRYRIHGNFSSTLVVIEPEDDAFHGEGATTPLAIVKACLKAKGVEV